jgi:hypothetical protein
VSGGVYLKVKGYNANYGSFTLAFTRSCNAPSQPGTISGISEVCQGNTINYSIADVAGATYYTWTLPNGWSGSSSTTSINATSGAAGGTIYVSANNGCGQGPTQSKSVTVSAAPAQPGAISGPTSMCQYTTSTYSISPVSGAVAYIWVLPFGWSGNSASTSINVTAGTAGGTISVKASNMCGPGAAQTKSVSVVTVPAQQAVSNINVLSGQNACYNATQTISVAGNNTYFYVQNGGSSTMVAGLKINYLPGTRVYAGGYMRGYIASGVCCGVSAFAPNSFANQSDMLNTAEVPAPTFGQGCFKVYPNPTSGHFMLELTGELATSDILVEIYGIHGKKVLKKTLRGEQKHDFSLSDKPAGIYIIRVISGNQSATMKIIKQ